MRQVRRLVQFGHVLPHHAAAIEMGAGVHDRLFHAAHPLARRLLPAPIERGGNLAFEQVVDGAGVQRVLVLRIRLPLADGPAAGMLIGLVVPAVQDAEVQHAVDGRLHAAGAAGFFAAPRVAEPQIHALHHLPRHLHVVVFQKDHVFPEVGIARELHNFADVALPRLVLGMGLAGDDDLHRQVLVQQNAFEPIHVAEQQRGALVGGEAAREPDGESVGIEHPSRAVHLRRGGLPPHRRSALALPNETDQAALAAPMSFQQFLVRNVAHLFPDGGVVEALAPVRLQILIV